MSAAPLLTVRIHIVSATGTRLPRVELNLDLSSTLLDLLGLLIRDHSLPGDTAWTFRGRDGAPLQMSDTLRSVADRCGVSGGMLELILVPTPAPGSAGGGADRAAPPPRSRGAMLEFKKGMKGVSDDAEKDEEEELTLGRATAIPKFETEASETAPPPDTSRSRAPGQVAKQKRASTERRATVRYYTRMNPDRMFPLLVILSAKEIEEVVKAKVKQAVSESFKVEEGSHIEIEPVLPGCDVYPPRHTLEVESKETVTESFWVVPRVLGRVHGARVLIRQGERVLAEVKLDVKVAKQTLAVACGLLSLAAPYMTMGLKSLQLDYESQKADGFPLYQQAGSWIAENLRPEWLGLGFLGLAFLLYLWMRPRRRDVFWDVNVK
jgi:hypothetical protein